VPSSTRPDRPAPHERSSRREVLAILLRGAGAAAGLVVLYYGLPLDGRVGGTGALLLPGGLALFGALTWRGVLRIIHSRTPRIVAISVLTGLFPLFIVVFAATYYLMSHHSPGCFSARLSRTDALYFTMTVFSTVGFGDLVPVSQVARAVVMGQMLGDLVVIGAGVHLLTGAIRIGVARQGQGDLLGDQPQPDHRLNRDPR